MRKRFRLILSIIAIVLTLALVMVLWLVPLPASEDDLTEAVLRYQFQQTNISARPDVKALCIQIGILNSDPSAEFLNRFEGNNPPVIKGSRCGFLPESGQMTNKTSGSPAVSFTVSTVSGQLFGQAVVDASQVSGNLGGAGFSYTVKKQDNKWVVTDNLMNWIS